jgi:hypothetical protein
MYVCHFQGILIAKVSPYTCMFVFGIIPPLLCMFVIAVTLKHYR